MPTLRSRVRSPSLTPSPSSPIGRGAWFRARRFPVRIRGGAPRRVNQTGCWASPLTSAHLRVWASTAPLSARGWLTELARCPAGNRRSRLAPWAGSSRAPSAHGEASRVLDDGTGFETRRASRPCAFEPHPLRSGCAIRLATEPALKPGEPDEGLAGPTPAASARGQLPNR